jgi:hypothetical protein
MRWIAFIGARLRLNDLRDRSAGMCHTSRAQDSRWPHRLLGAAKAEGERYAVPGYRYLPDPG